MIYLIKVQYILTEGEDEDVSNNTVVDCLIESSCMCLMTTTEQMCLIVIKLRKKHCTI